MQTAVVFNGPYKINYLVVKGNWSRFNGICINAASESEADDALQVELCRLLYGGDGSLLQEDVGLDRFAAAIRDGAMVIECGELP